MITWLHNGGRPVSSNLSTWPLLGMAMKVIQALGLHRDGEHFGLPQEEVMSRRRIFWEVSDIGCTPLTWQLFAYDIHHSVTIARPRSGLFLHSPCVAYLQAWRKEHMMPGILRRRKAESIVSSSIFAK